MKVIWSLFCGSVVLWVGCFSSFYVPPSAQVDLGNQGSTNWEADTQALLQQYVHPTDGLVDYNGLLTQKSQLNKILVTVRTLQPSLWNHPRRLAFWINVYNLIMLWNIVDTLQTQGTNVFAKQTVIDFKQLFFEQRRWQVAGVLLSLNDIEHGMLRRDANLLRGWSDGLAVDTLHPEIHIAISCAALSCPPIRNSLWKAETITQDLQAGLRRVLNQTSFASLDEKTGKPRLSRIIDWFFDDFKKESQTVGAFLATFVMEARLQTALQQAGDDKTKYVFSEYDWSLNLWKK